MWLSKRVNKTWKVAKCFLRKVKTPTGWPVLLKDRLGKFMISRPWTSGLLISHHTRGPFRGVSRELIGSIRPSHGPQWAHLKGKLLKCFYLIERWHFQFWNWSCRKNRLVLPTRWIFSMLFNGAYFLNQNTATSFFHISMRKKYIVEAFDLTTV